MNPEDFKINVDMETNVNSHQHTFTLEDLNHTVETWEALSKTEKEEVLQDAVNDLPTQPEWIIETFEEN